jgi:hypothetical protein
MGLRYSVTEDSTPYETAEFDFVSHFDYDPDKNKVNRSEQSHSLQPVRVVMNHLFCTVASG